MTVGYDVCHDPSDKRRSYGAMVATLDEKCCRWYSNVTRHAAGEELSINFASNIMSELWLLIENLKRFLICILYLTLLPSGYTEAVDRYKDVNEGNLPNIIMIFRDGVGEGQIEHVKYQEIESIQVSQLNWCSGVMSLVIDFGTVR